MKFSCIVFMVLFYACKSSDDNLQGRLYCQQQAIEDSITFNDRYENYYIQKALATVHDSPTTKRYVDSSLFFLRKSQTLKNKLNPWLCQSTA